MADSKARKDKARAAAGPQGPSRVVIGAVIGVVIVVAAVVAIVLGVRGGSSGADGESAGGTASSLPAGAVAGGKGIVADTGKAGDGAPTMDVYFDFQCPYCAQLEALRGDQIGAWANDGTVRLVLHPKTFLEDNLGNDSSSRAANAAACAADAGKLLEYYRTVFANQPAKEGTGFTDAQLKQFAEISGISGAALTTWTECESGGRHDSYIGAVETQSQKDGVFSTPTVKLNGTELDSQRIFSDDAYLAQQVQGAAK